jgi:hypothetical protein
MPIQVGATLTGGVSATIDRGRTTFVFETPTLVDLPQGTSSGAADIVFSDTRTLTTNTNEDLDLAGGVSDVFGVTRTFVKVKAIRLKAAAANTPTLVVGNGTNPFVGPFGAGTHTLSLAPGGEILLTAPAAGWTVTAATGDIIKVTNPAGASATYDVDIIGTSA